jgi:hypothetical protein
MDPMGAIAGFIFFMALGALGCLGTAFDRYPHHPMVRLGAGFVGAACLAACAAAVWALSQVHP